MKTTTLLSTALLGALTTFGSVAYAQDASPSPAPGGPHCQGGKCGPGGPGMNHEPFAFLNLTDAQKAQIKPIVQDERKQIKAAWDDDSLSKAETRAKIKTIHEDTQAKIKVLLTPEQQQKLADMKAKWEARKGAKGGDEAPQ